MLANEFDDQVLIVLVVEPAVADVLRLASGHCRDLRGNHGIWESSLHQSCGFRMRAKTPSTVNNKGESKC